MKRVLIPGLAFALVAMALPVAAQRPPQGGAQRGGGMMMNPLQALLEQADSLRLEQGQRATLELLRDSLSAANEPHRSKMQAARAGGGGRESMQELRPVMQQMRANTDAFVARALASLSPEQRTVAERIVARTMARRPGGGPAAHRQGSRPMKRGHR